MVLSVRICTSQAVSAEERTLGCGDNAGAGRCSCGVGLGISGDSDLIVIAGWKSITMLKRYTASEANTLAHQAFNKLDPAETLSA